MSVYFGLFVIVAVLLLAILLHAYIRIGGKDWLPNELKGAKVLAVEQDAVVDVPSRSWGERGGGGVISQRTIRLSGRFDQAYVLETGEVVPLEYKNRNAHVVYDTDVAQLSLQAWQIRQQGKRTAAFGFVVTRNRVTGQRKAQKVVLLDDGHCVALIQRYLDVHAGQVRPNRKIGRKCDSCGHKGRCHA